MQRSDPSTSTAKNENLELCEKDIENFFQVIADYSYDRQNLLCGTLTIFKKNYLEYLHNGLNNKIEKQFDIKKRMLRDQMKLLFEKEFFKNKLDERVVKRIHQDLSTSTNKLPSLIHEDNRNDLLKLLRNMDNTSQILHVPTEKNFPDKIQSGMTQSEKRNIGYNESYQAGFVPRDLNNRGIQHYNQREWQSAIGFFKAARVAEEEMSEELRIDKDNSSIAVYQRNIAYAYQNWSNACQSNQNYITAIQLTSNAMTELDKIPLDLQNKNDMETKIRFLRSLALSFNSLGNLLFDQKSYLSAVMLFKSALFKNLSIPNSYKSEMEAINTQIFLRNITYCYGCLGVQEFYNHNYDTAITHLQAAIGTSEKIPELKTELDQYTFKQLHRDLAISFNSKGLKFYSENNFQMAMESYELALQAIKKIIPATESDKQSILTYQNNFNIAMARIEAEKTKRLNPFRLFNDKTPPIEPEQKLEARSLKRNRIESNFEERPLKRKRTKK